MQVTTQRRGLRRFIRYGLFFLLFVLIFIFVLVNRFLEPVLRERIHTLIVQGSDSLYTYSLGSLDASFFGGSVEVKNLHIRVDSAKYASMKAANTLPSLTMQLDLERGSIRGVGILPLLFQKRITIKEIFSKEANVRLIRTEGEREAEEPTNNIPLWKAIQPAIRSIAIDEVNLDGIKLLYRGADTAVSIKLQFDRCVANIENVRIDSASTADTARIGFARQVRMTFSDLKFRTPDSAYKMKAEVIAYSSEDRTLEVQDFKVQPTLEEKEVFYKNRTHQKTMYTITFDWARFSGFRLARFLNRNILDADSLVVQKPVAEIYNNRTLEPNRESKIGKYPHQTLLRTAMGINVRRLVCRDFDLVYTEKEPKRGEEGVLKLGNLDLEASNVVNLPALVRKNPFLDARINGNILGSSPIDASFRFYLDSANGRFDARGTVKNLRAPELNALAMPMANVQIRSFQMHQLDFQLSGDDYQASARVGMRYNNLDVLLRKTDEETGRVKTQKLLTKILNRFVLYSDNPGPDGNLRTSEYVRVARISSVSFFGFLWKTIFTGMQNVMMKSGRYE